MIINLASGRGTHRIVTQNKQLLKGARALKQTLGRQYRRRRKRRLHFKERTILAKWEKLATRYNRLAANLEKLAYDVLETGDASPGEKKSGGKASKGEILRMLKKVEKQCCVELEGRRLDVIISGIETACPEGTVAENDSKQMGLLELEVAAELLQRAEEFLQILMSKEEKLIPTYEKIETYGDIVGELVQMYDALDLLEDMGQISVMIKVQGRKNPVSKDAIFRLFKKRMIGEIEELTNKEGEIYERRIHTITVGDWEDMVAAAASGVGRKVSAPDDKELEAAYKEAVLVRDAFQLAAQSLYVQMGGREKAAEAIEGGELIEVDFGK